MTEHPSLTGATAEQRSKIAARIAAADTDPDNSNMAQPNAGLPGPASDWPALLNAARAAVVVRSYLEGGDVRNALLVLGQNTAGPDEALELVKRAALEAGADPNAVLYAAARGQA